jgi:hypothetical protein
MTVVFERVDSGAADFTINVGRAMTDPVFAVLEMHKARRRALNAARDMEAILIAADEEEAAAEQLASTVPTTLPGAFAMLQYAVGAAEDGFGDWQAKSVRTVAASLWKIIERAPAQ